MDTIRFCRDEERLLRITACDWLVGSADRRTVAAVSRAARQGTNPVPGRLPAGRLIRQREFVEKPSALCRGGQASRTLISRTWFRILGWWLRRTMSCSTVGRGHRR